jgi:hypothetical protein
LVKVKVKQTLSRSGQALRDPGGWGSQISIQSAHEGGMVVSPTHWPFLPTTLSPENIIGTLLFYRLNRPQSHSTAEKITSMKNSNNIIGNRLETFRFVVQCLNQMRHPVSCGLFLVLLCIVT